MTDDGHEVKIAFPLWALGAAAVAVGLLTRRKLLLLGGAVALVADRDAEPMQKLLTSLRGRAE